MISKGDKRMRIRACEVGERMFQALVSVAGPASIDQKICTSLVHRGSRHSHSFTSIQSLWLHNGSSLKFRQEHDKVNEKLKHY